jgi:hypothetical protein
MNREIKTGRNAGSPNKTLEAALVIGAPRS